MGTTTSYVPYDYRRTCDLCGNLYNISKMFKKGPYTYCLDHAGERINEELDRGNARQRPFRILPVPNAKPEDLSQPDVFESDESVVFALLDQAVAGGARYLSVVSGSPTVLPNANDVIPTNAWACIHYYGLALAVYPKGHTDVWHAQAQARMRTSADKLLALQSVSGTRATSSYYGGFLASGGSYYYAEDAATAGLSVLYAYRLLGDLKYLYAARAAASFLRNLQAVGSNGVNFTSSDAAGTARLYTGAVTSYVSTSAGFYADHRFYPSSLLALQLWNELKLTDGDQQIGATAAVSGDFTTTPQKLMSACMADLHAYWASAAGFTTTAPAEYFNAYPLVKPHSNATGSGAWEYEDGGSAQGTIISSLNLAKGLGALFAVDGLTPQVTAIFDWLQTFTSNSAFETVTPISEGALARATTGKYDPTLGVAQLLLVRDSANGYAAIAKNGGSLYDWGAYGLLSPIWSARNGATFKLGRNAAGQPRRRLSDGLPSDGFWDDRGFQRGRQGLSMQTDFVEVLAHGPGDEPQIATTVSSPPSANLILWFKSDVGVTYDSGNQVTQWNDQGPNGWNVQNKDVFGATVTGPPFVPNKINGLPGLYYSDTGPGTAVGALNYFASSVSAPIPIATDAPRTILALAMRDNSYGGIIFTARQTGTDHEYGLWNNTGAELYGFVSSLHGTLLDDLTNYQNTPIVMDWRWLGIASPSPVIIDINGNLKTWTLSGALQTDTGHAGFSIGNVTSVGASRGFSGWIAEVIMYSGTDPGALAQARAYLMQRSGQLDTGLVYDAVAAAQYGLSMRLAPRS